MSGPRGKTRLATAKERKSAMRARLQDIPDRLLADDNLRRALAYKRRVIDTADKLAEIAPKLERPRRKSWHKPPKSWDEINRIPQKLSRDTAAYIRGVWDTHPDPADWKARRELLRVDVIREHVPNFGKASATHQDGERRRIGEFLRRAKEAPDTVRRCGQPTKTGKPCARVLFGPQSTHCFVHSPERVKLYEQERKLRGKFENIVHHTSRSLAAYVRENTHPDLAKVEVYRLLRERAHLNDQERNRRLAQNLKTKPGSRIQPLDPVFTEALNIWSLLGDLTILYQAAPGPDATDLERTEWSNRWAEVVAAAKAGGFI